MARSLSVAEAKPLVVAAIAQGKSVKEAILQVRPGSKDPTKLYENWRSADPSFRASIDRVRRQREGARDSALELTGAPGEFERFRQQFFGMPTYRHQRAWIDVLEGRAPELYHESVVFEQGQPNRVLVNTPPNHPLALDTEVFTADGFKRMADLAVGDRVLEPSGSFVNVTGVSEIFDDLPMYRVVFSDGTEVEASGSHRWLTRRLGMTGAAWTTTEKIAQTLALPSGTKRHRIAVADPHDGPEADLPMDPYLFGYWLGDGKYNGASIGGDAADIAELKVHAEMSGYETHEFPDSRAGVHLYLKGGRAHLRATGMFEVKDRRIPEVYFLGSFKQRLALLQGLMDSDGTISAKDSRARFVQVKRGLAEDVFTLAASLGLMPHFKTYSHRTTLPQGGQRDVQVNEVGFRTTDFPVFRLARKAVKQRQRSSANGQVRVIRSVERIGGKPSRCITVDNADGVFLATRAFIATGNSKSMTVTIDYITYRVARDPNIRVIIVSKTQKMAQQFLYAIKSRLTHPKYLEFQVAYGPADGFKASADQWTANQIYLGGESKDSGEKDPTVQVLGIGGQIYGARADLVILDDCVVLSNAGEWEKQMTWLNIEVASRLGPAGKLVVIGTRVAPVDLYQQLRNGDHYVSGKSPWTYLAQPAVLSYGDGPPESWVTLWPKAAVPFEGNEGEQPDANGEYRRWDGPYLSAVRDQVGPRIWSMVYQQQDVSEDAIFHPAAVRGSVAGMRKAGPLRDGAAGHPRHPEGFHVVAGIDPAMTGDTAAVVMAVDRNSGKRYVMDVEVMTGPTPEKIRSLMRSWTDTYRITQWVVESNAFQLYLVHDELVTDYLRARGCTIRGHYTSRINKHDEDFGVAAMAPLFGTVDGSDDPQRVPRHQGDNLIELPSSNQQPGVKALVEQLVAWQPKTKNKTDAVMALWFAETAARDVVIGQDNDVSWYGQNRYASPRDAARRVVVDISDWQQGDGWVRTG